MSSLKKKEYFIQNDPILNCFRYRTVKRIFDQLSAILLLVLLVPVFLILIIIIKLSSNGPIFFKWNVVGKNGKAFTSWKFRTMVTDADTIKEILSNNNEMSGPVFKIAKDPRITKYGCFIRKYSLDELPQLWSVVKGDMSLVGPRPAGEWEWPYYEEWQRRKLSVIPGLTCLWQVNGRNTIANFDEWIKMDLQYIDNWSLLLDFKILLKTITIVFGGTGV